MGFLDFLSCVPQWNENYFFTKISEFDNNELTGKVFLLNEQTGLFFYSYPVPPHDIAANEHIIGIYKSTDGGKTLKKIEIGEGEYEHFTRSIDKKGLYLIVALNRPDRNIRGYKLYSSLDEGESWQEVYTFEDKRFGGLVFFNDMTGFAEIIQDPIGYDDPYLLKTENGGLSWTRLNVNVNELSLECGTTDERIMGTDIQYNNVVWEMNIHTQEIKRTRLEIADSLAIYGLIISDPVTRKHYVKITNKEYDKREKEWIYCLETKEQIEIPDTSYGINVYNDNYISILGAERSNTFMSRFFYSTDRGKTWHKEVPPCHLIGTFDLYGKGIFWSMAEYGDHIVWPLMVRIPNENEK